VPSSPCRRMKATCASVNFDLFMVLPRPTARITHAAKLEFSSKDWSNNREAGQVVRRPFTGDATNSRMFTDSLCVQLALWLSLLTSNLIRKNLDSIAG
jgi:hypothetical protein